ncbi:hypothetical protein B9479_005227 [Cryptococcus floricola]|uniref:Protein RER1 n=1 Tax=Cryptococcus floricola TaxID=2591691 RepID=A0A5D3AV67_9TREE|nr:hypothetical protein B9479_005227 [Cryptococcus floricola]
MSYPAVSPYPPAANNPATGPGSGFPPTSGLAGVQPHSMSSTPAPNNAYGANNIGPGSGAGYRGGVSEEKSVAHKFKESTNLFARRFQAALDRSTPMVLERWLLTLGFFIIFLLNVIIRQGWYIVCYALAIYILNLFLAFLQPRFDPSLAEDLAADDVEEGAPGLPGGGAGAKPAGGIKGLLNGFSTGEEDEEFRPFIRRLPEFKFWYSATKATSIALLCTITRATDVPVYWPILVIYFFTLFGLTMRRQIQHMIKYKYVPFDLGKKVRYGRK